MAPPVWIGWLQTGDQRYAEYAHAEFKATRDYLYDREEYLLSGQPFLRATRQQRQEALEPRQRLALAALREFWSVCSCDSAPMYEGLF